MNLRTWITDQHAGVADRLRTGVLDRVPADRWAERVPSSDGGPPGATIAGLLLHLAVHQDLAVNVAVRGRRALLDEHRTALGIDESPRWTGLPELEDPAVVARLPTDVLVRYGAAVHDATAAWLDAVELDTFDQIPPASHRLDTLAGVDHDSLDWLHRAWADRPVGWFVQWEVIGHGYTHVGEMVGIRNRMGLSPF